MMRGDMLISGEMINVKNIVLHDAEKIKTSEFAELVLQAKLEASQKKSIC